MPLHWLNRPEHGNSPVLLCIHGWAADHRVWHSVAECLPDYAVAAVDLPSFGGRGKNHTADLTLERLLQWLQEVLVECARIGPVFVVGWSLGGQLAAMLAERSSDVVGLICVASNPCFVQKPDWLLAMPETTFCAFHQGFKDTPALTFKRFVGLQLSGAEDARATRKQAKLLLSAPEEAQIGPWSRALQWLRMDTRSILTRLQMPQLHVLADRDALVPAGLPVEQWGEVQVLANSCHCLPLERPQALARAFDVFVKTHSSGFPDKRRVADAFSQAAADYDVFARIQKLAAEQVLSLTATELDNTSSKQPVLLDIGTGTGALVGPLLDEGAEVVALDIAEGMLRHCHTRYADRPGLSLLAGDAERLPIGDAALDGIVSSLAVQWCSDLPQLFVDIYRVLKPGGFAVIATLGPKTLWELKVAWQQVDACVHVNGFVSQCRWRQAIVASGLQELSFEQALPFCEYSSVMPLLKELKAIGAHNSHGAAPAGLMTRKKLQALEAHYPDSGELGVQASYDIFYWVLRRPLSVENEKEYG